MVFRGMVFTDYIQLTLKREFRQCSSFLELGCGKDSPATSLVRNFNLSVGLDLHQPSLRKNKEKRHFKDYVLADIRDPPFKSNSFDCVVALDVIEHLSKPSGYRLMEHMENISLKKIVILTPNGCCHKEHIEDSNILQHHRSAWVLSEFLSRGHTVFGINGIRALRGEQGHATIKPKLIGHLVSKLTDRFVYNCPQMAFQLLCIKSKSKTGK
jgi:2-polyprenyl-3-methyl-5-hydroxy-6-metoxy-1,4-benzoquinol methylase